MPYIELVEYNPAWPKLFEEEKVCILAAIGEYIDDVQHIGSTSVPGLGAKPIIDILISLPEIALVESCVWPMQQMGYEYLGEAGIPGRHFFRNPPGDSWEGRKYNVHVVERGGKEWQRHILFRDYLRAHPEVAQQYYLLKQELANKYRSDPDGGKFYPDGKSDFVAAILARARM